MAENHDRSRREVLRKSSGIIGFNVVLTGSVLGKSTRDMVTLPRTKKSPTKVVDYHKLSRKWWEHVQTVQRRADGIRAKYGSVAGVETIGTQSREDTKKIYNNRSPKLISIEVSDKKLLDEFPDSYQGTVVRTEFSPERITGGACYNLDDPEPAPGGNFIRTPDTNDSFGTSGFAAKDEFSDNKYVVTCQHLWSNHCDRDLASENVEVAIGQSEPDRHRLGYISSDNNELDTVLISPDSDSSVEPYILEPNGYNRRVAGYHSESSVEALDDDNETCYKVGVATGKKEGAVLKTQLSANSGATGDCETWDSDGVKTSCGGTNGDSGGPIYTLNGNNEAVLVAIFTEYDKCITVLSPCLYDCDDNKIGPKTYGPAVYEIVYWENIEVLT